MNIGGLLLIHQPEEAKCCFLYSSKERFTFFSFNLIEYPNS